MNRPEVQNKGKGAALHSDPKRRKEGTSHRGISRVIRVGKREEAEARNAAHRCDARPVVNGAPICHPFGYDPSRYVMDGLKSTTTMLPPLD